MPTADRAPSWRGFSAPLGPDGAYSLYGPPPWRFEGYSANVTFRVAAAAVAGLVPPPLQVARDPIVRLSVFDFVCDCGRGPEFVQRYPDLAQQAEAVVGVAVELDGKPGYWPPLLWCTSDAEMAVGREMYGWAQRLGSVSLTRMPLRGWRRGDFVTGLVSRGDRAVFEFTIELAGASVDAGGVDRDAATADSHIGRQPIFTQTSLADPDRPGQVERRLVVNEMENVTMSDVWHGAASVHIAAPEIAFLRSAEVLEGRWFKMAWTKPFAQRVLASGRHPA